MELFDEAYYSGDVSNLEAKFPKPVLDFILKEVGLTREELKANNVSFTFYPSGAPGSQRERIHRITGERAYGVNIDPLRAEFRAPLKGDTEAYGVDLLGTNPVYFVLAHELQHLEETLHGKYYADPRKDTITYYNQNFPINKFHHGERAKTAREFEEYRNQPWEVAANKTGERVVQGLVKNGLISTNFVYGGPDKPEFDYDDPTPKLAELARKRALELIEQLLKAA